MSTIGWIVIGWVAATVVAIMFNYGASVVSHGYDLDQD